MVASDIVLESIRLIILLIIIINLWNVGKNRKELLGNGWNLFFNGFLLLLFGNALDITDNFESLNRFVIIGDTEIEAFLEKMVGFLGGFLLIAIGLIRWIPAITSVDKLQKEIDKHEKTGQMLKKERNLAQNYLDIAKVIIVAIDSDQRVTLINKNGSEVLGYGKKDIIGRNWFDTFIPEESRHEIKSVYEKILAGDIESVEHFENTILTKNGNEKLISWNNTILKNEDGNIVGTLSSGEDITERKQADEALQKSENKYRNLTESFNELIYRADPETFVATYVNRAVERIYGRTMEEWLNDPNLWEQTIYPDDKERVFAEFTELQTKLESGIVEYRIIKKDKTIRWVQDHVSWEKDQQGKPLSLNGIISDITETVKAQEAMLHAKILAEDANRTKSEFIMNMSHELRTPLNSIIGFSDVLYSENHGTLNESQKKYASNIFRNGKHLLNLINDILDLSKIEAGRMELQHEKFRFREVLNDVEAVVSPLAEKKNICLNTSIGADDICINADRLKLTQVLFNLVSNAIKFTDQGGSVTIGGKISEHIVHIFVKDSGIGISPEEQDKLFNPFFQADSSTTKEYGGTGLGLALVKKFVEMHDGQIWVDSEVGKGSTFTFRIPTEFENTSF